MPSKNRSQARLMAGGATRLRRRVGVPQSVAKEFNKADAKTDLRKKPAKKG